MEKEFVSYEQALDLKELGFDELCICIYNREKSLRVNVFNNPNDRFKSVQLSYNNGKIPAPLYQQTFRWFREKFGLSYEIHLKMSNNKRKIWYNINELDNRLIKSMYFKSYPKGMFKTYEEAELDCLNKLIELCKKI